MQRLAAPFKVKRCEKHDLVNWVEIFTQKLNIFYIPFFFFFFHTHGSKKTSHNKALHGTGTATVVILFVRILWWVRVCLRLKGSITLPWCRRQTQWVWWVHCLWPPLYWYLHCCTCKKHICLYLWKQHQICLWPPLHWYLHCCTCKKHICLYLWKQHQICLRPVLLVSIYTTCLYLWKQHQIRLRPVLLVSIYTTCLYLWKQHQIRLWPVLLISIYTAVPAKKHLSVKVPLQTTLDLSVATATLTSTSLSLHGTYTSLPWHTWTVTLIALHRVTHCQIPPTAMIHMTCDTACLTLYHPLSDTTSPIAMTHMSCDTACLTLYHPLLDTTSPTAMTHMSCETACLTLYHSLSDTTSLTAMIHMSWDTHCLTCVSCQEELASGTFLQASADALMMKSLTDSLPPVLANTSFSSLRSLELKLKHDIVLG